MLPTVAIPEKNASAQKQEFPPSASVADGLATESLLIDASVSCTTVSAAAVTLIAPAAFVVPVALTLTTTVCAPVGMLAPRW